jgi:single-strand DNA-binding protein
MNQLILVGRLVKNPVIQKIDGKSHCRITLAVKRQYKNLDGIYETDFITCTVWNVIAERVCEYCQKGDLISVKGRIQNDNYTDKDDKKVYSYEIIAEQVAFMQSQNKEQPTELTSAENE